MRVFKNVSCEISIFKYTIINVTTHEKMREMKWDNRIRS